LASQASYASRQFSASDALQTRDDFPGWPQGPRISNLPIRRMRRRSKINSDGCHRSRKHPLSDLAMIDADSDAELDFLMFAEVDPCVTFIVAQPTRLTFAHDGRIVSHLPDFAILRGARAEIVEVKGARAVTQSKVSALLEAAHTHVENWSEWSYVATSTTMLLADPCRPAVEALWRHLRRNFDDRQLRAVLDTLSRAPRPIADVVCALAPYPNAPSQDQILSMAATNSIWIDFCTPIGPQSLVRHPDPQALPDSILPCCAPGDPKWR
jgi:hypothetical protein